MGSSHEYSPGVRLLSLDGGGIRGLSELIILREIMRRIQHDEKLKTVPRPCEYFDLIGGTSTGGLIAIMLGRLQLSVDDAIESYRKFAEHVFSEKKWKGQDGTFKASKLEDAIKGIVADSEDKDAQARMLDHRLMEESCKTFVCAMPSSKISASSPTLFRSYAVRSNQSYNCRIWEAARATSAAPLFFKRIVIDDGVSKEAYIDGALGCNNPVKQVLKEAQNVFGPDRRIACVLSIGTGQKETVGLAQPDAFQRWIPIGIVSVLKEIATTCNTATEEVEELFKGINNVYFRLNVDQGMQNISLQEWKKLEDVANGTNAYLKKPSVTGIIDSVVNSLRNRNRNGVVTTGQISMSKCVITPRAELTHLDHILPRGENLGSAATTITGEPYYEIPPLQVPQYVERVEFQKRIEESFNGPASNKFQPRVIVLLGMGGQGKTQLALEYCRAAKASGKFQAIFWIDASSLNTVSRGFEFIAEKISSTGRVFSNIESKIDFVKETLGRWRSPWLMVFDNYDKPSEFGDITTYLPQGETGTILFTSRHADSECLGVTIKVTRMTEDEGLELLLYQSKLERNDDNVTDGRRIIQKLGYLPLAIDQASAYIRTRKLPLRLFAKHYDERKEVVLKYTPSIWEYRRKLGEDTGETLLSVFTTWELSFQQIGKNENERVMVSYFLTLSAFLNATDVSEDLFRSHLSSIENPPEWIEHFASNGVWDQYKYQDIIVELQSLSLLQSVDIGSAETRFSLHPLVRDWLKLRKGYKTRQEYTFEATMILTNYINSKDQGSMPFQTKQDILSHIDICLQNKKEYLRELDESDTVSLIGSEFTFASFYQAHDRYQEAEEMYQRALAGYEKALGPSHTSTLDTTNCMGILYWDQGRLAESEAMYQRTLVGREKVLGPDHPSTLDTISNLGNLYKDQNRLAEAEAMYQRALSGTEKALGLDHTSTLDTVNSLGILYWDQGRLTEAEAMYQRALLGREKALGLDHTSTLDTVNSMGILYWDQGRLAEAETMYQRALLGREKALGPDHTSTLDTVNNLGNLYKDQGRLSEAESMYQRALTGTEKVLGRSHMSTLDTVNSMGIFYWGQGKLVEAETMFQRALMGREEVLGPDHTSTLDTVNSMGILYWDQGRLAEAEAMYRRALLGREKVLGPDHTSVLDTVNNLGNLYWDQSRLSEAEAMYQRALIGTEKALGPDHPSTLDTVNNLGLLYKGQGRLTEAIAMYERVLTGREKVLGPCHTSTLDTVNNLGTLYKDQGKLAEAEAMRQRALMGKDTRIGPHRP